MFSEFIFSCCIARHWGRNSLVWKVSGILRGYVWDIYQRLWEGVICCNIPRCRKKIKAAKNPIPPQENISLSGSYSFSFLCLLVKKLHPPLFICYWFTGLDGEGGWAPDCRKWFSTCRPRSYKSLRKSWFLRTVTPGCHCAPWVLKSHENLQVVGGSEVGYLDSGVRTGGFKFYFLLAVPPWP